MDDRVDLHQMESGASLDVSSGAATYNTAGQNTPMLAPGANLPKSTGRGLHERKGDINYFKGFTQVTDP